MRGDTEEAGQRDEKWLQAGQVGPAPCKNRAFSVGLERWACRRDQRGQRPTSRAPQRTLRGQRTHRAWVGEKLEHALGTDHREPQIQGCNVEFSLWVPGNQPINVLFCFK